ncbi:tautomerase family protein [Streptomyces sp. NPDC004059]
MLTFQPAATCGTRSAHSPTLNQSLVQALGIPEGDRFIMISEHGENELYLDPTFMGMQRSDDAVIITLLLGAHRPLENKRAVAAAINRLVVETLRISPDDVFIALIPVPNENFSFGRGELQLAEGEPRW